MNDSFNVAIGSILGDGNLKYLSKRKSFSQLYVSQHNSKLPYLKWLHGELGKAYEMHPIKPKKGYNQHYFITKSNKILGDLKMQFYSKGYKDIPSGFNQILTSPISLAVWYMDDGTLDKRSKYHFNASIATYCFSFEGCELLSQILKDNFQVLASVTKTNMRGKVYPRLYIKSQSMDKFISLVKPYIHPVFKYKIGE